MVELFKFRLIVGIHIRVCPPSQGETIEKSTVPFADLLANALSEYESSL